VSRRALFLDWGGTLVLTRDSRTVLDDDDSPKGTRRRQGGRDRNVSLGLGVLRLGGQSRRRASTPVLK
jgi:hypothetical protein